MQTLFSQILSISATMSAVLAAAFLFMHLYGRKCTARCRYLVWTILILRLCLPVGSFGYISPVFTVEIPAEMALSAEEEEPADTVQTEPHADEDPYTAPVPVSPVLPETAETIVKAEPHATETNAAAVMVPQETAPEPTAAESVLPPSVPETVRPAEPPVPETPSVVIDFSRILFGVWLIGAVGFFLWQIVGYHTRMNALRQSAISADEGDQAVYRAVCLKMGIRNPPKLMQTPLADSPMVCGFFTPWIVLPEMSFSDAALTGILSHELTHWRRGDVWRKLAALTARSLHWFNPLVHLASSRYMRDMEMACDEAVLAGLGEEERRLYGQIMLDIVRRCHQQNGQLTTRFNPRKSAVMERFRNIMDTSAKKRGWWIIGISVVLCLTAGVFVACEVQTKPEETESTPAGTETEEDTAEDPAPAWTEETEAVPEEETVLPPEEVSVVEPVIPAVELDAAKYALSSDGKSLVYTGFRVDLHEKVPYSYWYIMELPQINGTSDTVMEWNRRISETYLNEFAPVITALENDAETNMFFRVSYETVQWEDICTIAIYKSSGYTGSDAGGSSYDIYHYDTAEDVFLTADQFLARYTDGRWTMDSLLTYANETGIDRDEGGGIVPIAEENVYGVIPSVTGDGVFDLCYLGYGVVASFCDRVMILGEPSYLTAGENWTDLGGNEHTTASGVRYDYVITRYNDGYHITVYHPAESEEDWIENSPVYLNVTLAYDTARPVLTWRESYGEVYLDVTEDTPDGSIETKPYLCRDPEDAKEYFNAYLNDWVTEEEMFYDVNGYVRHWIMDDINRILELYTTEGAIDPLRALANPASDANTDYPNIPVRTAVDWTELNEIILKNRVPYSRGSWILPVDLGSGYTMELLWGVGGMGDTVVGYAESLHITTGDDPITSWRPEEGAGLYFSVEIGDTGEYLLSYTGSETKIRLYRAYYAESGKVIHEPVTVPGTYRSARAIWAADMGEGMQVLLEVSDGGSDISYLVWTYRAESVIVLPGDTLVSWTMSGAPVQYPNTNLPESADTLEELDSLNVILPGTGGAAYENSKAFVRALLENDAETLASLTYRTSAEMYEQHVFLSADRFLAWADDDGNLHLSIHTAEHFSRLGEALEPGRWYTYTLTEGMFGVSIGTRAGLRAQEETLTGAAAEVQQLLNWSHLQEFPETDDMDDAARVQITELAVDRLAEKTPDAVGFTAEEIRAYAKTCLGITDFTPSPQCALSAFAPELFTGDEELYTIPAHGANYMIGRIMTVTEQEDGTTLVEVQYYADANGLIPSDWYQYVLEETELGWAYRSCTCTNDSRFDPIKIAV